ncbi:MAG: transcription termination/antitermination NusG family protein [Solirubrobacteraceae bacterium]
MFRWYVVNTYSGHENKVKHNLEHRVVSLGQQRAVRSVVVPTETVMEMKDNQKNPVEKRTMPGYVLVNMELNEDSWGVVKGTPGVTGFVGASQEPVPLTQVEVDRLLHKEVATATRTRAQITIGSPSRSSPARCRTSPARSPRSTRTPRASRCWYQSSAARRPSKSNSIK